MPLIDIGNKTLHIKLNLLRRRSTTHRNGIIIPPLLIKQTPQQLHKSQKIGPITRIHDIPRVPIIHAITRKVLPINANALEDRPLLEEGDDTFGEGLTGRSGADGKGKVLGPSPAADCQCEVKRAVELVVEFCELAEEAEVLRWGGPRVLGVDAIADKWVLEIGPAAGNTSVEPEQKGRSREEKRGGHNDCTRGELGGLVTCRRRR